MAITERFPEDRVRNQTSPEVNVRLDEQIRDRLRLYLSADEETISHRIEELDREWDIERRFELNAGAVVLTGTVLSLYSRRWLLLPMCAAGFLLQHAIQGGSPPVQALRRWGVRTRIEIERERYALKLLRGDFGEFKRDIGRLLDALER